MKNFYLSNFYDQSLKPFPGSKITNFDFLIFSHVYRKYIWFWQTFDSVKFQLFFDPFNLNIQINVLWFCVGLLITILIISICFLRSLESGKKKSINNNNDRPYKFVD